MQLNFWNRTPTPIRTEDREIRSARAMQRPRFARLRDVVAAGLVLVSLLASTNGRALIFPSPEFEPTSPVPPDFPYWENVTQRRYEGPSVIYLGNGWALTARHVGMGEIFLEGRAYPPDIRSHHTLLNLNGTAADAMVFRLTADSELPDLPLLPLAREPLQPGEDVLVIGFGRGREKVIEWMDPNDPHQRQRFAFAWSRSGRKRWGTNRIVSNHQVLVQKNWRTHAVTFRFDPPDSPTATPHEAQAAIGDSGGAVFVKRDGRWLLAGMMTSVSARLRTPKETSAYGDTTYAADVSFYRSEIIRWTRPDCANEEDDDGDGKIDFPLDPDCHAPTDPSERRVRLLTEAQAWLIGIVGFGAVLISIFRVQKRRPN